MRLTAPHPASCVLSACRCETSADHVRSRRAKGSARASGIVLLVWSYNNSNNNSRTPPSALTRASTKHYPLRLRLLTPSVEPYTLHGFAAPRQPNPQLPYGSLSHCWAAAFAKKHRHRHRHPNPHNRPDPPVTIHLLALCLQPALGLRPAARAACRAREPMYIRTRLYTIHGNPASGSKEQRAHSL